MRLEERVFAPLGRLRRRCRLYLALNGIVYLVLAIVYGGLAQLALDRWLKLSVDQRAVVSLVIAVFWLWVGYRSLLRPLLRPLSAGWLAAMVDRAHPQLHDQLATVVQFAAGQVGDAEHHSPQLVRAVMHDACRSADDVSFFAVLNHRRAKRRAGQLFATLLLITLAFAVMPDTFGTWFRRNWLLGEIPWPQWTHIRVLGFDSAGRRRVPRGDELEIVAAVTGRPPPAAVLDWRTPSGRDGRETMTLVGGKQLRASLGVLSEDVRFRIVGGDERTREYVVEAVERPAVVRTVARITPPAYTSLDPVALEQETVLEVLSGSTLEVEAWLNKPVARAEFAGSAGPVATCELVSADHVRVRWAEPVSGSYHFALADADGWENRRPVRYTLKVVADQPPDVRLELADTGRFITPQAALPIRLQFKDAYGLGSVSLCVQRADDSPHTLALEGFQPLRRERGVRASHPRFTFQTALTYAVESIGVTPGDRLRLWAEARDCDPRGPNVGRAEPLTLHVVSHEAFLTEMARREIELRREFEHLISAQRGLKDALERILPRLPGDAPAVGAKMIFALPAQQITGLSRRQQAHAARCRLLGQGFGQLLAEMRTSRAARPTEQRRIGDRIVAPLETLGATTLPVAAKMIFALPAAIAELRHAAPTTRGVRASRPRFQRDTVRATQEEILRRMQTILANMLKREGYREAVALLQEVIDEQGQVRSATLELLRRQLETILNLDKPAEPSPTDGPNQGSAGVPPADEGSAGVPPAEE